MPFRRALWPILLGLAASSSAVAADLVVKEGGAALLANCGDASSSIQQLEAGTTVSLRFSIAGAATTCHSVSAEVDGRKLAGYVSKESLGGLDEVGITLTHEAALVDYEQRLRTHKPWLAHGTGLAA